MYLTAQRVRSAGGNRQGVNVFLYSHQAMPAAALARMPIQMIADQNPGELALEVIALPPGTNEVTSYLDVVAPDDALGKNLARALDSAATHFPNASVFPLAWEHGELRLRYHVNPALHPDAESEFRRLKDKLRLVLGSGLTGGGPTRPAGGRAPNPLRIVTERDDEGRRYRLETESLRLLRSLRPDLSFPASLGVSTENEGLLRRLYGSSETYGQYAIALTGLAVEQLKALAGVIVIDEHGQSVWTTETG